MCNSLLCSCMATYWCETFATGVNTAFSLREVLHTTGCNTLKILRFLSRLICICTSWFVFLTLYALHLTPYALHSRPYTLHPTPHTLHPKPHPSSGEGVIFDQLRVLALYLEANVGA